MIKGERVHIVSLTFDPNVIMAPLAQMDYDRVYAFRETPEKDYEFRSAVLSDAFKTLLRDNIVIESRRDLPTLYDQLEEIVNRESRAGNSIFINLSSGTRVFTAAAALVSAKYDVELYYVHSKPYYVERNFTTGVERVELLNHAVSPPTEIEVDATLAFVLMPFSVDLEPIYEDVLVPLLQKLALRPVRADEIFDNRQIMDDIWENIERSRVVIADLTGKNPNVFYETGIAHALGKEVILMAQTLEDVPFDLRALRCIVYANTLRGAETLAFQMEKTLDTVLERTSRSKAEKMHNNASHLTPHPKRVRRR